MTSKRTVSLLVALSALLLVDLRAGVVEAQELDPGAEEGSAPASSDQPGGEEPTTEGASPAPPLPPPLPPPINMVAPSAHEVGLSPVEGEAVIDRNRLVSALVQFTTAWSRGFGYLIGDRRTVVLVSDLRDRYRRITVKMAEGEGPEVSVVHVRRQHNHRFESFVVLQLESDLPGTPLEVSDLGPAIGDTVLILHRLEHGEHAAPNAIEVAQASITASSRYTLTVGEAWNQIWRGSPVFDQQGRVVAFFGNAGFAMRINEILAEVNQEVDRQLVTPTIGLRLGTEFGGFLEDPLTIELEFGVALWDQLGIMLFVGAGLSSDNSLVLIEPSAIYEAGVAQGEHNTVFLGLELEYRLLLTRSSMPFYLDFALGLTYTISILEMNAPAFYATEPGCDPLGGSCGLTIGEPPTRDVLHAVGLSVGLDLRAGPFVIGYRFIPEGASYNQPNTHRLNFGLAWR